MGGDVRTEDPLPKLQIEKLKVKIVDDKLIRMAAGWCLMETVMRRHKLMAAENIRGGDLTVIGLPAGLLSTR